MGFFGTYLYSGGAWNGANPDVGVPLTTPEPWLYVDVHDSDFTTLRYSPAVDARGEAFLGFTPNTYFDRPTTSAPTDATREAAGLATWARAATGQDVAPDSIRAFLASDGEEFDEGSQDDADIFVEIKTQQFIRLLGLVPLDDLESME